MATAETRRRVAHLLRRAGFGATAGELDVYADRGVEGTVDLLLNYEKVPDTLDETLRRVGDGLLDIGTLEDAQTWWLYRLINSPRPLQEKMTLFWHGHFATGNQKVQNPVAMHLQNHLLRTHAVGNVQKLVLEVSKDTAMQLWLDNNTNRKAAPNENYARELLELFTLGIGSYTEKDVQEVARAFTGWNLNGPNRGPAARSEPSGGMAGGMAGDTRGGPAAGMTLARVVPAFQFNANQHDYGPKTILGRTGTWNGDEAIGIILSQPAHAPFLVNRLFRFFAYDRPEEAVIAPLIKVYRESGYELKPLLRALFLADAFYSDRAVTQHVKSPVEFVVGAVRALQLPTVRVRSLLPLLASMGQELYNPPNVGGWPGGRSWISPASLAARFNAVTQLVSLTGRQPNEGGLFDVEGLVQRHALTTWEQAVDVLFGAVSGRPLSPEYRAALLSYTGSTPVDDRGFDVKLRGLAQLILTSAEGMTA